MVHVALDDGTEQTLEADAVVIATGSSWPNPSQFPIDGKSIVTSRHLLELSIIPRRLLILGGGVEGCEFATLYSGLGAEVTVVELMDRILPLEDEDVSAMMTRELKKRGATVMTGTTVDSVEGGGAEITVQCKNGEKIVADILLVSVGRGFNSRGLGLEDVGVEIGRRGEILVNEHMETTVPDVYAIGDVVGKAMLAHVASAQGKVAVENIMGHRSTIRYDVIPAGIFTLPEIGRVGLTEAQARERARANGLDADSCVKVGRFRFVATGKAQATGETTGFCKIISESESGRILGAHIVGSHAADLIHETALAMKVGASVDQIADMIHAHPTMAEGVMEAAEDSVRGAIHQVRKRAN